MYKNYYPSSRLFHGSIAKVMGTRLDALLFGDDSAALDKLWGEVEAEVMRLERMLNRFDEASALTALNCEAAIRPSGMNSELLTILSDCRQYHKITAGCFDVTLGRWSDVTFDETACTVSLRGQAAFDLGGYAKGYALELIRRKLMQDGVRRALICFGDSSILAVGTHPHGDYWPIGIDNPYNKQRIDNIRLRDSSLSVSGNMPSHERHIVQPATGKFVESRKIAVAVAPRPIDAEVLTTALMAADGQQDTASWLKHFDIIEHKMYNC